MSDEPEKRSRPWIWWAILVILLLAYPLSMPPALSWGINHRHVGPIVRFYSPMLWAVHHPSPLRDFMNWYGAIWGMGFTEPSP